jgi:predicted dienelactone hydrolase
MKSSYLKQKRLILTALWCLTLFSVFTASPPLWAADRPRYDASDGPYTYKIIDDITLTDEARNRQIPLRIYCPEAPSPVSPVLVVSHGLGGSKESGNWVGQFLATHGYILVFMTHYGSDTSLLDLSMGLPENIKRLQQAIVKPENIINRPMDVTKVIDSLDQIQKNTPALTGRMDLTNISLTGHSFGAFTTLAVDGAYSEQFRKIIGKDFSDRRPKAFLAMSPQSVRPDVDPKPAFAEITRPTMIMTGSEDVDPIMAARTAESRMDPFKYMPAGDKYALWIEGAHHFTFGDGRAGQKIDPFMRQMTKIATLAFFDAYLKNDQAAKAFLQSDGIEKMGKGKIKFYKK